jgi:glycosyltransferase involved in cell wall biosynthesis
MAKVSIFIPSRNERFLVPTVNDLLTKARGDIEIIAVCDGYWPNPPLPEDKRLKIFHKGKSEGMRGGINDGAALATGDYLMKIDGHCLLSEGYDVALQKNIADGLVIVPRRYSLDAEKWEIIADKPPVDYHFLSYPYEKPVDPRAGTYHPQSGLHGNVWRERARERKHILFDDEMSSQGSCWFMTKTWWQKMVGPLDVENYGTFVQEFQEVGNKTWLGGGAVKIDKEVSYAHLHKGKQYGRGYAISVRDHAKGHAYTMKHWMLNGKWDQRQHDIKWLIEKFWPVPGWPKDANGNLDWDEVERQNEVHLINPQP